MLDAKTRQFQPSSEVDIVPAKVVRNAGSEIRAVLNQFKETAKTVPVELEVELRKPRSRQRK